MSKNILILFNSTVAFIIAAIMAVTLHEIAHLVTGKILGLSATLYPTAVDFGNSSNIITPLVGPIFSLIFGLLLINISTNWGKGITRLFWLWLGFISAQIGFGYVMIAQFSQNGDTGLVLKLISAPQYIYLLSFIVGLIGMLWLARMFAFQIVRYAKDKKALRFIGLFSWLIGTGILLIIYTGTTRHLSPQVVPTVLAGIATVGIFTPMLTFFYKKSQVKYEELVLFIPYREVLVILLLALVLNLILANGIKS